MELQDLRVFLVVAEERHFGRAANILAMNQPSVSRRIRALEASIGVKLFERGSRRVGLTPAGLALLEKAPAIVGLIDETTVHVRDRAAGLAGRAKLGGVPGAMLGFIPYVIRAHLREYPGITLSARELLVQDQLDLLRRGLLDVGFVRGHPELGDQISAESLHSELMCVAVSDTHPLAHQRSTRVDSLRNERIIMPPRRLSSYTYDRIVAACRSEGFEPMIVQEAATASGIIGLVAAEVGISVVAEDFYALAGRSVRLVPLEDFNVALTMLWRKGTIGEVSSILNIARRVSRDNSWNGGALNLSQPVPDDGSILHLGGSVPTRRYFGTP